MRVLITNHTLQGRSGTETFVRDLALSLKDRGHTPMVYAPVLGPLAEDLRERTIPVVDDLSRIREAPDVIHGHHRHQAVAAMLRFPETPALFVVHDWHSWHDDPPRFPQILRYVAVDETRRDRLVLEQGIDPARVAVIPNGVDTHRFRPRRPPPERPSRALVFSSYVRNEHQIHDLSTACRARGIQLDALGSGLGRTVADPEQVLPDYDLVFAMGRSAQEAMAVGSGVVVWGVEGLGGFVTPASFPHLSSRNFGRRTLRPANAIEVGEAIDAWSAEEVARITERVRARYSLEDMTLAYESLYKDLRAESALAPVDPMEVLVAAGHYMEDCVPRIQVEAVLDTRARRRHRRMRRAADALMALGILAITIILHHFLSPAHTPRLPPGGALCMVLGSVQVLMLLAVLRRQLRARPWQSVPRQYGVR